MENLTTKKEIVFDSDDTEASDLSYESSCESDNGEEVPPFKRVNYFKEEMSRFFFNHPELKNDNLIERKPEENYSKFNKGEYWASIAGEILEQAKTSGKIPALKAFTKRLNIYRSKVGRTDVVDLILQEHVKLLRQIDSDIQKKQASENTIDNSIGAKFKKEADDVTYYSWRKNKQLEFRIDKAKEQARQKQREESFHKPSDKKSQFLNKLSPKTQPVKVLVDELKKCPDVLTMKKVMINFLVKYRQQIDKQFMNRPSLLQQSQKYYTEQTKQFVLLYPSYQLKKKLQAEGITRQKLEKGIGAKIPSSGNTTSFDVLNNMNKIMNGTLMTYWKAAQDRKL